MYQERDRNGRGSESEEGTQREANVSDINQMEQAVVTEEAAKNTKKIIIRKPVKILKESDYTNKEIGLKLLYDCVSKKSAALAKKAELKPEEALRDYMSIVKEWSFNLAPKYRFDYFMDRTQKIGRKGELAAEMSNLRKYHKKEMIYDIESKKYIEAPRNTEIIEEQGSTSAYTTEKKQTLAQMEYDYDPNEDDDRAGENFVTQEMLDIKIQKKVVTNEEYS